MINVLVFPCGSEIGLEINEALKRDKNINLFGLSSVPCHGRFVYERYLEGIATISDDSFLEQLNVIIDEYSIDVLIPAYDDVILFLSNNRDNINCQLVTSSRETCQIARSKKQTYELLKRYAFIPETYEANELTEDDFPVFAKPDIGQGSEGAFVIESFEGLEELKQKNKEYVISEMLPGKEYTIDCFTDLERTIVNMSMRERKRMRNGISVETASVQLPDEVRQMAEIINNEIEFNGVWFFQVKLSKDNQYKLLEVAPRVAGSMSLSRVRGFNYILNAVYQAMGHKIKKTPFCMEQIEESRALSNVYKHQLEYEVVYVDLDDTLVLKNGVNQEMIAFLYQCQNQGKKLKLISRHLKKEEETLIANHIDPALFSEIVHVEEKELKSDFIKEKNAIFIDDSFRERLDVSSVCGIPVFDLDGIVALRE